MDLSGLIFVALAVAWGAYLIPKALRHHDDVVRGRSVDRFSQSMRVLARREPISSRAARLVVRPTRTSGAVEVTTKASSAAPAEASYVERPAPARRTVAARAASRRRRVLGLLLFVLVGVVVACTLGRLAWAYVAIPVVLLVGWLVACRLMVKKERTWRLPLVVDDELDDDTTTSAPVGATAPPSSSEAPTPAEPGMWDPVPMTLPTYVSKPPARRTVRTIDLDSTGVWTSGRTEADSAIAREAEAAERVRRRTARKGESGEEAVGS